MEFTPEDNQFMGLMKAQKRIKELTNELLAGMSKEQLLTIIADMNAEAWYSQINTGKSDTGNTTVAQFMTTYEININLILSEDDSDMFEITTG